MRHPRSARWIRLPFAGAAAALSAACAAPSIPQVLDVWDPQSCAEDAMRRPSGAADAKEAVPQLELSCRLGDPVSCSMLGVASELGLGVQRDLRRAAALYRRACESGNARGCANLGELLLQGAGPLVSPAAVGHLKHACALGQGRSCQILGRAHAEGLIGSPLDAVPFYERACALGSSAGCVGLADLVARGLAPGGEARALELSAAACGRGDPEACDRVARARPRPEPDHGPTRAADAR